MRAYLHDVALNNLQMCSMRSALYPALQLQHLRSREEPISLRHRLLDLKSQSSVSPYMVASGSFPSVWEWCVTLHCKVSARVPT